MDIQTALNHLLSVDGAICATLVDSSSGMTLGSVGGGVDVEMASAGSTEVIRAKQKAMHGMGLKDNIEDILITLGKQYHLLRPMAKKEEVFLYFVLDRGKSNLALARRKLLEVEQELAF